MGLIEQLPCYIAGQRFDADENSAMIHSFDGKSSIPLGHSTSAQLRRALRYAHESQKRLNNTTLAERIEVTRLILKSYQVYREEVIWGLAEFRGMVAKDSHWMIELLEPWSHQIEVLLEAALGSGAEAFSREIQHSGKGFGSLDFQSKGVAALFCASTMDGPPAIDVICHAILSGTHLLLRPSGRDTATHFLFEILLQNNFEHYAQLVRWPSSDENNHLDRQLLQNVDQGAVFGSDETYDKLLQAVNPTHPSSIARRFAKYGTGLPLVIVAHGSDIEQAAQRIVEGARRANGRFCLSHGPVLVQKELCESLKNAIIKCASALKKGSLLDLTTDIGAWDQVEMQKLKRALPSFGGNIAFGEMQDSTMDVLVLEDVPVVSPALYSEFPATVLFLIPFDSVEEAAEIAKKSLKFNRRDAWLALNVFSDQETYKYFCCHIPSYNYMPGRVTPEPRFVLPHQGSYFCLDLLRRFVWEDKREDPSNA